MDDDLFVTKPSLPPLEELLPLLETIWDSGQLTNHGPLVRQLEQALAEYFDAPYVSLCANGTLALLCSLRALDLPPGSEVITTPYTFVATTSVLLWLGLKPVFIDINTEDFNLAADQIEAAISPHTRAIVPVHCYGAPCAVRRIGEIARNHGLFVVYDAAHAFGSDCDCGSLLSQGDASIVSFHATKVFNTFEGGCVVTSDAAMKERVDRLINFGFVNETEVRGIGINAKMSEFNAAVGLLQLPRIDTTIAARAQTYQAYVERLSGNPLIKLPMFTARRPNYSYFPILLERDCALSRDDLYAGLKSLGIHPRRYFFPLVVDFPDYQHCRVSGSLRNAKDLSERVLCLPMHAELPIESVERVCDAINTLTATRHSKPEH